jgi:Tfp pilus assembly protein PilX
MNKNGTLGALPGLPARQAGAVLIIALIVLVAMTLSALALIRSVNTTNLISGNLAFRESALLYAERATETALNGWLIPKSNENKGEALYHDNSGKAYWAARDNPKPEAGEDWGNIWEGRWKGKFITDESSDVTGNSMAYIIHRLCKRPGEPHEANCSEPPDTGSTSGMTAGSDALLDGSSQVYYRITSRVIGPRNTVVYTQTIVVL